MSNSTTVVVLQEQRQANLGAPRSKPQLLCLNAKCDKRPRGILRPPKSLLQGAAKGWNHLNASDTANHCVLQTLGVQVLTLYLGALPSTTLFTIHKHTATHLSQGNSPMTLYPPSTAIHCPVMYDAAGEARKANTPATSSAWATRLCVCKDSKHTHIH